MTLISNNFDKDELRKIILSSEDAESFLKSLFYADPDYCKFIKDILKEKYLNKYIIPYGNFPIFKVVNIKIHLNKCEVLGSVVNFYLMRDEKFGINLKNIIQMSFEDEDSAKLYKELEGEFIL